MENKEDKLKVKISEKFDQLKQNLDDREDEVLRQVDENKTDLERLQFKVPTEIEEACRVYGELSTGITFSKEQGLGLQQYYVDVKRPKSSLHVASWNLENLDKKKVDAEGVVEALCKVIDKNGFDVVAIQEVCSPWSDKEGCYPWGDKEGCYPLEKLCKKLNENGQKIWKYSVSKRLGKGYQKAEYGAFLWNLEAGVTCVNAYSLEMQKIVDKSSSQLFSRHPFVGIFQMKNLKFTVISMHIKAKPQQHPMMDRHTEVEIEYLPHVIKAAGQDDTVILLGDFNISPDSKCFGPLKDEGYCNVIVGNTNISGKNEKGNQCYDHIWIKEQKRELFGRTHIVRATEDLKLPGTEKTASNHCPVSINGLALKNTQQ